MGEKMSEKRHRLQTLQRVFLLVLPAVFLLGLCGVGVAQKNAQTVSGSATEEENIQEALFRYLMHPRRVMPLPTPKDYVSPYKFYFLSVGDARNDPSENLLKRFVGYQPPVKKLSDSYWDQKAQDFFLYAVKDKATQQVGKVFRIGNISWLGRDRVEVRAGYYSGGRSGGSSLYMLVRRRGGQWVIVQISNTRKS